MQTLSLILPNHTSASGCGQTMIYMWNKLKNCPLQSCIKYHLIRGKFKRLIMSDIPTTIEDYINEDPDYTGENENTNYNIDTFIELLQNTLKFHRTICIEYDPYGDDTPHYFTLTSINDDVYIIDSYVNIRGPNCRKFDFGEFTQLLHYPAADLFNKIFMCNEDSVDNLYVIEMGGFITILY